MCEDIERELQLNYEAMENLRADSLKAKEICPKPKHKKRKYTKRTKKCGELLGEMQECRVKRSRR